MLRVACFAIVTSISIPAAADRPTTALGVVMRGTTGGLHGDLGREWSIDRAAFGLDATFRRGRFELYAGGSMLLLDSSNPERDTTDLFGFGAGGGVGYHLPIGGGFDVVARAGYAWRWLSGASLQSVTRTCDQTGECAGGFWSASPTYGAHGPTFALGVETLRDVDSGFLIGGRIELEVAILTARLPGDGAVTAVSGRFIGINLSLILGGAFGYQPRSNARR